MSNIVETVESFLKNYNIWRSEEPLCVGFSGGFDSMCLIHILALLKLNVVAIHLNHNWRGEESAQEEENCRRFCEKFGIKFYSEKLSNDIPHTETAARSARYKFFEKCMQKFGAIAFLTAHNANDNAETLIYRIAKGTGVDGLAGIAPKRDFYYRPLLNITRDEIEEYCLENKLSPNKDSSNNDVKYARNLIRHKILPLMKQINPDILGAVNSLSDIAKEDTLFWDDLISKVENSTQKFLGLQSSVKTRVIKKILINNNLDYDRDIIERLTRFIEDNSKSRSGGRLSVGVNKELFVSHKNFEIINISPKNLEEIAVKSVGKYVFRDYIFEIEECRKLPKVFAKDSDCIAYVNLASIDFVLRTRREGDYITPLGMFGTQKLKKYLNEKKIPYYKKDELVLLCDNKNVLWVAGVGVSDKIKVVDNKVTHVLKLIKKGGYSES